MQGVSAQRFILLTDIGGSSRLWEEHPGQYPEALEAHNRIVEDAVRGHGGEVLKNLGDGFLSVFEEPAGALDATVELQLRISGADAPEIFVFDDENRLAVRAVVHGGTLQRISEANDWFGTPLNRAARIAGVAHPGQTLLSGFARQRLLEVPSELELVDLGRVRLRDLGEPEHLFQVGHPRFAERDFPALLGMDSRPNNLREQPGAFIGREEELLELRRLLLEEKQRLITLIAPGGYGKSRCANQLCASLLHRYEHGAWTVELAMLPDAQRIAERTADALGFQFFSADEPRAQLVNYLRAKQALIHFDNFEHVTDGANLVAAILAEAPEVQCVVTSRVALKLRGEQMFPLNPLPTARGRASAALPAAVELFADRAVQVNPGFKLDEQSQTLVEGLCQRLDGVPLAVELAAAWIDIMSPAELLEELSQQLDITARMSDVPERQRSVRASCDWSWNLLNNEQQTALMQCACFRGGFFIEAASAVLGKSGMQLRALLAGLLDKSWLYTREQDGHSRYAIRDAAAREYAWEKLYGTRIEGDNSTPYERTAQAHADYFVALVEREGTRLNGAGIPDAGSGQLAALRVWRTELENINEALDTALHRHRVDWLLPIARYLEKHLDMTGGSMEARTKYGLLLAAAERLDNAELKLAALLGLCRAQWRLSIYAEARDTEEAALALARELADRWGEAASLNNLGIVEWNQGNYAAARELYAQSLAIKREIGDREGEAASLNNLGLVEWNQGNYAAARELYAQSLAIKREIGDRRGESMSLNNLGAVELNQGNSALARELCGLALSIQREIGDREGEARSLNNLGLVEQNLGNYATARELHLQELVIRRELGDRHGEAMSLDNLGVVERDQGNYSAARELYAQALTIVREIGDRRGEAMSLDNLGVVERDQGNYRAARELYAQALTIVREIGDRRGEAMSLDNLGVVEYNQGNYSAARELHAQALAIRREIGDKAGMAISCAAAAAALARLGHYKAAAVALDRALVQAEVLGYKFDPDAQQVVDAASAALDAAAVGGRISAADLAAWQAKGEAMSIEELADFTLTALTEAR